MEINIAVVAGISVTAVVAAASILDKSVSRRPASVSASTLPRGRKEAKICMPSQTIVTASQESSFVTGNMMLATNL